MKSGESKVLVIENLDIDNSGNESRHFNWRTVPFAYHHLADALVGHARRERLTVKRANHIHVLDWQTNDCREN